MKHCYRRTCNETLSVSAAVCLVLYGTSRATHAAPAPGDELDSPALAEVVVTAQRRTQTTESIPYSLSVVTPETIRNAGVTDIESLTSQVPGLSMYSLGASFSGAQFPIIRGLNASGAPGGFRTFQQAPVGTYIGNSPVEGYFQLDDVERIEVLKGPQGTLYGAGTLGGALRIIPKSPELSRLAVELDASVGYLAHSGSRPYSANIMLNIPIGDTVAFRASGKFASDPGFINVFGLMKRSGSFLGGIPSLANPGDPVGSSAIFSGKSDWNDQQAFTGRASLLWKPNDAFKAELAYTYGDVNGHGGPTTAPLYRGGAYPLDPSVSFPAGGPYRTFSSTDDPFSRRTTLTSVDLSYDVGFATLSSTSSYQTTSGMLDSDGAVSTYSFNATLNGYAQYYAGSPISPRFIEPLEFGDSAHTFTQEVRLVSAASPEQKVDYAVGAFFQNQVRDGSWIVAEPGSPERALAQGCTAPYYIDYSTTPTTPAPFPNCLIAAGPGDVNFDQRDRQEFKDKSLFGKLTWHFATHAQVTVGGRHFWQSFKDLQSYTLYTFDYILPASAKSSNASKNTWKIDLSYEYATGHHAYVLWSQGFRRGGVNALPTETLFHDNPDLLRYRPDTVDNYEVGIKGHFDSGVRYTLDVFDDEWKHAQVEGNLPDGNLAVWNANGARSRGVEGDVTSPLPLPGLSLTAGGAYADAIFSQGYSYEAIPGTFIYANPGQQLPGSPKVSVAATLNYSRKLTSDYDLLVSLNDTYRSEIQVSTFPDIIGILPPPGNAMNLVNASMALSSSSWHIGAYVTNLADKRAAIIPASATPVVDYFGNRETINRPREISLRLGYTW